MGIPEPGPLASLERLGHGLVAQLRRRLELLAVEVREEQLRFSQVLGWQLFALFLLCLAITLAVLLLVAGTWDGPSRVTVVGALLFIVSLGAGATWWIYRERVRRTPVVFAQTLEELRRDEEALSRPADDGMTGVP